MKFSRELSRSPAAPRSFIVPAMQRLPVKYRWQTGEKAKRVAETRRIARPSRSRIRRFRILVRVRFTTMHGTLRDDTRRHVKPHSTFPRMRFVPLDYRQLRRTRSSVEGKVRGEKRFRISSRSLSMHVMLPARARKKPENYGERSDLCSENSDMLTHDARFYLRSDWVTGTRLMVHER